MCCAPRGMCPPLASEGCSACCLARITTGTTKAAPTVVGAAFAGWSGLAAGELLAESSQGLVRGQGTGRRRAWSRAGRDRARCGRGLPGAAGAGAPAAPGGTGTAVAAGRSRRAVLLGLAGQGSRFFLVGLAGLLDLPPVRLEPSPRLGVLVLPLLTLLLVAGQPFAGLRVEAFRVLVVALLVVGGRHAVQGRVEVVADRLADRALVGLLERQADAAPVQVDVDDLDEDLVAHLDDLLR